MKRSMENLECQNNLDQPEQPGSARTTLFLRMRLCANSSMPLIIKIPQWNKQHLSTNMIYDVYSYNPYLQQLAGVHYDQEFIIYIYILCTLAMTKQESEHSLGYA